MKKFIISSLLLCTLSVNAQITGPTTGAYIHDGTPEQLLRQARLLYNEGSYDIAEALLQTIETDKLSDTQRREAATMLTVIAYKQDVATALSAIEKYLYDYPDTPEKNRMMALALLSNYAQGNYQQVINSMYEIDHDMLRDSERDDVIMAYAFAMIQEERYEEAIVQFDILKMISDRYDNEATFYIAYANYVFGRYDLAQEGFEQVVDIPAFNHQTRYYLAETALAIGEYQEAEAIATQYLDELPNDTLRLEMKRIQGEALYAQDKYLQAVIVLEEYLAETDNPKREVLYQLGMAHYNSGEYLRAPEVFAMITEGDDIIAQNAALHAGLAYLKLDDKNKARLYFEQAAAMTASLQIRERALYNYTVCMHETSYAGFGESVKALELFLNEFPHSVYADRANSYLVENYMSTKNYEAALQSIAKIQTPSATILEAKQVLLYKTGVEAFVNGDIENAVVQLNKSLKVGNYNKNIYANTFFWRGEAMFRQGNYRQAAKDYTQYLSHTTDRREYTYALALYGLGYTHFVQKNYHEAFRQFNLLMQSHAAASGAIDKTTLADAQMRIGDCYFHSRQYSTAEQSYNKAIDIAPETADYALYQKGFAQGLSGRYTDKVGTLTFLIENYPQSDYIDDALYEKGRAYVQLNNGDQAIHVFEQLFTQFPQSQYASKAGNEIALIHYQNNHINSAIKAYKMVIMNYPGSEQANVAMRDLKNLYVEENMVDSYIDFASQTKGMVTVEVSERDSLTYKAAELAYIRGDEAKAIEGFTKYLTQFNNGAYITDAQYYLGCIYNKNSNYDQARVYLQRVADQNSSKYCEEATRMLADIAYNHKDYTTALDCYTRLIAITNNPTTKLNAQINLLRSAQVLGKHDIVVQHSQGALASSILPPETAIEIRYYRAKAYLAQKKNEAAIDDLCHIAVDTRNIYGAEAKYLLAELYYNIRQYDKAEQEILDYINVSTPHTYWLARSFILLSDVYMQKDKHIEAKQYLLSLKQSYTADDDIAEMIEVRLNRLNTEN